MIHESGDNRAAFVLLGEVNEFLSTIYIYIATTLGNILLQAT